MKNIIEIDHLQKSFGDVHAVNDLSFRVKEGELFAFLGINGAGKSTTINIMCGQLAKDSGSISICDTDMDKDSDSVKRALGVVFQGSVLDRDLSVYDNLESRAEPRSTAYAVPPSRRVLPSFRKCWTLRICESVPSAGFRAVSADA